MEHFREAFGESWTTSTATSSTAQSRHWPAMLIMRWRERLAGMTCAWSVECPFNDQRLVRLLVSVGGGTVFMGDSGG
jgi:hypothetical protein